MTRNREYNQQHLLDFKADHLGYPYPPMPCGGPRQVLGSMSTNENVTPEVPDWVPKRLWLRWSDLWHSRQKQYKFPHSKELLPWDTTHSLLGDYNGHEEYYVKGCFGYDEDGEEIMYRPVLPQIHQWHGQGLHLYTPVWDRPQLPSPDFTMFNFYTSTSRLMKDELDDINMPGAVPVSHLNAGNDNCEESLDAKDNLPMTLATDIFGPIGDYLSDQAITSEVIDPLLGNCTQSDTKDRKAVQNLMSLPGEVRNIIYRYLFDESKEYEIVWCTTQKDLTHYVHKIPLADKGFKTGWRYKSRDDDSLDAYFERPILDRKWTTIRRRNARMIYGKNNQEERIEELRAAGPAAFLLTCSQAYKETVRLFYRQHTFCFCSRSLLRNFISKLSRHALGSIKRLYIAHDPQAWPLRAIDAVLVNKEHEYWIQDLRDLATCCTSLQELNMLVRIRDPHVNNADRAEWAMALRRGLAGLKRLDKFEYFNLAIRLADDTSNVAAYSTALQLDRSRDLQDLVQCVKNKIFGSVQGDQ